MDKTISKQDIRHQAIVQLIEDQGVCSYQELEKHLNVSNMTIRRDVDQLAANKSVIKTLGGIQKANAPENFYESSLISRLSVNKKEKRAITQEAMKLIEPGQSIYLDGSSTSIELAKRLALEACDVTIVTNSLLVYTELTKGKNNIINCIGGQHDPVSFCLTGPRTEDEARRYHIDMAFLSTKGFPPDHGMFESSAPTYRIKQIMAQQSSKVVLMVDHTKFNQRALFNVLSVEQIDTVITDEGISESDLKLLKNNVKNVHVVSLTPTS